MRTDVYSWRLSPDRKAALEELARREGTTIAGLLEQATDGLLIARDSEDQALQARLHAEARKSFGAVKGLDPAASTRVRAIVRGKLLREPAGTHGRSRAR